MTMQEQPKLGAILRDWGTAVDYDMVATIHPQLPVGSTRFHEILDEMGKLHDQKQADYGRPNDPFANVRATEEWGSAAWVGAMIRATDKMRRLQTYARTGKLANEGVRDSFLDLAVYAIIALVLWEEQTNE